jgi:hypothetical protein
VAGPYLARDEAGNVWETDAQGNPLRLHNATPNVVVPAAPDPDKAVRSQLLQLQLQQKLKEAQAGAASVAPSNLSGPAYLKTLDRPTAALVQALADGRKAFPTGMALKTPYWQNILQHVANFDPGFDEVNYTSRAATRKDFTSGKAANNIRALNTAIGHLGHLEEQIGGTASHGFTPLNAVENAGRRMTGDSGPTNFDTTVSALAGELTAVYRGSGGAEADIQRYVSQLSPNASREQKEGAIRNIVGLLKSRLDALNDQYRQGMGTTAKPLQLLDPQAQKIVHHLGGFDDAGTPNGPGGGPPPPPITPATGPTKTEFVQSDTDKKLAAMLAGGAPGSQIKKFVADNGGGYPHLDSVLAWRALHPTYKGGYDVSTERVIPTTLGNRLAASPAAAAVMGAGDAMSLGLADEGIGAVNTLKNGGSLSDNIAAADLAKQSLANANPEASFFGNIAGGTAAMLGGGLGARALLSAGAKGGAGRDLLAWALRNPIKSAAAGDTLYGAGYGAGENNDNRALGAAVGAPAGLLGSFAGSGLAKAGAGVVGGVVDPAVQRLRAAGIPLTAGEVLGGGFKKGQDALTSVFGPGNMVARRYAEGRRALNEAAFNAAGQVVDTPINAVGQQGVDLLDAAKSQAYSDALDPISLNLNTPKFLGPMSGIMQGAEAIPAGELPEGYAANAIRHYVGNNIEPGGAMSGPGFQSAYRGMAKVANKASGKVEGHDVGQALGQAKDILASTLEDQNPGAYAGFLKANSANRHLNILANAVNAAKNQVSDGGEVLFTPAQLGQAATQNAKTFSGNIAAASGSRPFNQLALDSQKVMSSKLPDSGTPMRLLATALATGGGGGLGYGANGGTGAAEGGIGTLGLLTALGTKKGQQLLTAALLKRTLADQVAARSMRRNPQIGGDVLASFGIPLLDSPAQ